MTSTLSSPTSGARRSARRKTLTSQRVRLARTHSQPGVHPSCGVLGRYTDWKGRPREIVAQQGSGGSVLVVDRDVTNRADRRLVAHLAADEPVANAALVCGHYLEEARCGRPRCRPLTGEDLRTAPPTENVAAELWADSVRADASTLEDRLDHAGCLYRLEHVQTGMSIPELRWCEHPPSREGSAQRSVSMREAIAKLEAYEPVRTITLRALALHRGDTDLSTTVLRAELERVLRSPIVLNRGLRLAVLAAIQRQELSLSEIATRCGRVKRDPRGNESGETSWLARRLGILPEGGRDAPTPWIHSDVLALIARRGLGVSPREVELG
jgi:hypothetical protein